MLIEKKLAKMMKRNLTNVRNSGLALSMGGDRSSLPLIISICFAGVTVLSAIGILGWVTGQLVLAQINPSFIPIAPMTILILVLLGASWFLYGVRPEYSWFRIQAGAVGVLVVVLTSLTVYHAVMPGSFSLEALLFPNSLTLQGYPLGRISPVTDLIFLLGGLSLMLLVWSSGPRMRTAAALVGIVIVSCGVVTVIGYLYQAPLLYGSPVIPVSLPAAIAFLFLGTEMWAAGGRDCWPTRKLDGDLVQARLLRAYLPLAALTVVAILVLDQIIGDIFPAPIVLSLDLLSAFVAVVAIAARLSSGIGAEIDHSIAQRAHLEKSLQESEEKYRVMVENSPNMIGIFQDGVLKYVNSVAILKLGWTYEELVSPSFDPVEKIVSQKSRNLLKKNIGRRLRGEDIAPYEISLTRKDGSEVPVLVKGAKIIFNQKPAIEFVFIDISELREMHDELERYSKHLQDSEGKLIALHKYAQQLASATSLDEIIKYTLDAIESPLGVELADFYVVDTEKECLRLVGLRGWSPSFSELSLRGPGFTVIAANSQRTVRIPDIRKEEGYVDAAGRSGKAVSTTRLSELAVPVIAEGKTVALLNVESSQFNAFNDEDQRLLETLAVHVASALERLRQVEKLEVMAKFTSENPNPVLRLDRHGTVLSANEASKALLQNWGSGIGQVVPKPWRDLVTDALLSGEGRNTDIELGGRSYTLLVKPIVKGDYANLYGAEITERKRAEEKVRQSEERYHSLFDRMLDGTYLSTHEGRFVDVNPAFVKMFGYSSKEEMLAITDIKKELYFSPEERGSHILDTDQEEVKEYRMRRKDGSEIWVEDHGGYVHDEQGNIIYHEGALRDMTERKRLEEELKRYSLHLEELVAERTRKLLESEEELRASRERLEYVVASNPAVLVLEKPFTDLSNTFSTFVSESARSVFGFEPKNFLGERGSEFFNSRMPPDDLAQYLAEVPLLWSEGHHTFEFRFLHSDGAFRWIREEMKVTRDAEERPLDVVGVCTDVTERKKLQEKLAKAERLAAIGETAAMVGHDLRNPLQGIAGALYLLKKETLTAEERYEMLQVIEKSVHYSDAIVKDLLDYSTEIKLKLAEATPKSITSDAIGAVKIPQNVTVRDLLEDQPTLSVDRDMMKRVFINLIENAVDAMPQGGILTISSKKSDGNVEIKLTDTGAGIPKKLIENLWKPLRTTKATGMGLGLAICKRIVETHGGSISVKSEIGHGTTFTIQLPFRPVEVK